MNASLEHGYAQFVALSGSDVVGWCDLIPKPRDVHAHTGVLGMGVVEAFRSQGVGRRLLEATMAAAWARGLARIELTVFSDNLCAIRLYEKLGFAREGEIRDDACIDGRFRSSLMMAIVDRSKHKGG